MPYGEPSPADSCLEVTVTDGRLVISIGVTELAHMAQEFISVSEGQTVHVRNANDLAELVAFELQNQKADEDDLSPIECALRRAILDVRWVDEGHNLHTQEQTRRDP